MSSLGKFLVFNSRRVKVKQEGKPGKKTPFIMRVPFHPDLEEFIVSDSKGSLVHRGNCEGGVPTVFFPLPLRDEDPYQAVIADYLFQTSCVESWGNVALTPEVTADDLSDYIDFFESYDLTMARVFCGPNGLAQLVSSGKLVHPSGRDTVRDVPDEETLNAWKEEYFHVGTIFRRPVYYNDFLDPYLVFSSDPFAVGLLTRMGDYVSLIMHNPERSVIVVRLDEDDHE